MQRLKDDVAALLKDQWRARGVSSSASESSRSLPKTN
jgi:hypothetical protein